MIAGDGERTRRPVLPKKGVKKENAQRGDYGITYVVGKLCEAKRTVVVSAAMSIALMFCAVATY